VLEMFNTAFSVQKLSFSASTQTYLDIFLRYFS
jgi:hypothetical protein